MSLIEEMTSDSIETLTHARVDHPDTVLVLKCPELKSMGEFKHSIDVLLLSLDDESIARQELVLNICRKRNILLRIDVAELFTAKKRRARRLTLARALVRFGVRRIKGDVALSIVSTIERSDDELIAIGKLIGLRDEDAHAAVVQSRNRIVQLAKENNARFCAANRVAILNITSKRIRSEPL